MTPLPPLVLADYAVAPRLTVSSAVSLGIKLLSVVPKPAPSSVRFAAARLRDAVVELQAVWGRMLPSADAARGLVPRQADTRSDRSFRAVAMRLEAFVLLGPEATAEHDRAAAIGQRLFPEGLRFLTLPFDDQWAHAQRLFDAVSEDAELADDLETLVGESIMAELRAAHAAYGEALGITAAREAPEEVSLTEPMLAVRTAITGYALQIIAMQDLAPARIPEAHRALTPIDELRARQSRRSAASPARPDDLTAPAPADSEPEPEGEAVTPSTPVPVVEAEVSPASR